MYIQSPPYRRQRPKRVNVKHAVQICLFLAIFFWLLYQIKHSHYKSKEFDETEAKASSNRKYPNLGRKGIYDKTTSKNRNEIHEAIKEKETVEEEDKLEEYINKTEEEDDADGMYMDLIHEEEFSDGDENIAGRLDFEDALTESDKGLLDMSEHNGDSNNNTSKDGAREENYKADDASSSVTHEAQMGAIGNRTENLKEQSKNKMLEEDTKEVRKGLVVEGGEIASVGRKSNVTISGSPPNGTLLTEKSSHGLRISGSAEVNIESYDMSETKPELDHGPQASGLVSSSTDSTETKDADFLDSSTDSTVHLLPDSSLGSGNKTVSLSEEDEMKVEKKDVNDGTFETSDPEEGILHDDSSSDKSDASDSQERHMRADLIQAKETNSDVSVAAE